MRAVRFQHGRHERTSFSLRQIFDEIEALEIGIAFGPQVTFVADKKQRWNRCILLLLACACHAQILSHDLHIVMVLHAEHDHVRVRRVLHELGREVKQARARVAVVAAVADRHLALFALHN